MKDIQDNKMQINFLNKIKELTPDAYSYIDELADLLKISQDSVYRRIRGNTALSINEVAVICKHYHISFDLFTQSKDNATFSYNVMQDEEGFVNYLSSILDAMIKTIEPKNKQVTYAAIDIPIFYHFKFPELGAFKMFYWMKTVNNVSSLQDKKFDINLISPELREMGRHIYEIFVKTPCVEIWSDQTVNSLVKQIEFFYDSGNFKNKEDALLICNQAREEIEMIKKQAELCSKDFSRSRSYENSFSLYYSDIEIGSNTIFVEREDTKLVFITFNTFNALVTPNTKFIKQIEIWIANLIKKSTLISGVSQKLRYQFFQRAFGKIDKLYDKIDNER